MNEKPSMTEEQIKKFENLAAIITTRVNSSLKDLGEQCYTDVQASDPSLPPAEIAAFVANVIVATLLAQLREGGYSEEMRHGIIGMAVILESHLHLS